ncbi:exportin-4-like [Bacillus rossius redtenbacheri]|uniref:exportin-4-like n=1 Tax=Bacillus rossius redtenbacheri TaxID=93214 RepID=UPI002FDE19FD
MESHMLSQLENASMVLLASPLVVTGQQRKAAEELFMNFRKTKCPYAVCRHILENSSVTLVQFEAADLLKDAVIREWSLLQAGDVAALRQYLLHLLVQRPLEFAVRDKVLQVLAITVKRSSVEDFGASRGQLLAEVEKLVSGGDCKQQVLGCCIISALMQEYAYTVKSADVGLTWETHFKAKKQFEGTDLKRVFHLCLRALGEITRTNVSFTVDVLGLLRHLIGIAEGVLTWNFIHSDLPKRLVGMMESSSHMDSSPTLRLGRNWHEVMLDPDVVDIFYKIHWKVRVNADLSHHSLVCLVQLATLSGRVLGERDDQLRYLANYVRNFLHLVTSVEILDREALGVSNMVRKLVLFFPPPLMAGLPEDVLRPFLAQVTAVTCRFAERAAQEELMCSEDRMHAEAFDHLLEAWLSLLQHAQELPPDFCSRSAAQVLGTYVRCHLSPPHGCRGQGAELNTEDIDETEEDDRTKFKDQLQIIGVFGRHVPEQALGLLTGALEERTHSLHAQLQGVQAHAMNISDNNALACLFEDLHWLVMIASHVLCMESDGECPLVPAEMMRHSMKQAAPMQNDVQRLVYDPGATPPDMDHVLRLVVAVLRLAGVEQWAHEARLSHLLSPELACSVAWFLRRWALSYLMPPETYYSEVSVALLVTFGKDSASSEWAVQFLLCKVESNLRHFHTEAGVVEETVALLVTLCEAYDKSVQVVKSSALGDILALQASLALPQSAKRGLFKALALAGAAVDERQPRAQYWTQVLKPLQDRFKALICRENFGKLLHEESVRLEIIDILESLIGVTQGSQAGTVASLFGLLHPLLSESAALVAACHNYQLVVELVLELYCECSRSMLHYLSQGDSRRMYQVCLQAIQNYGRCNVGRLSKEASAEDDTYHDILLLMDLLINILSKDVINLNGGSADDEDAPAVSAADVCMCGLGVVMPLMTAELLKLPALCRQYYKMATFLCEFYPEKVFALPGDLLAATLRSLQLGLSSLGEDVVVLCCDCLQVLAADLHQGRLPGEPAHQALRPFLPLLMDLILSHQIKSDHFSAASAALYTLICCFQTDYQQLVQGLLDSREDPGVSQRLAAAFTDLTAGVALNANARQRDKFRENFDKFVVAIRSFLLIK